MSEQLMYTGVKLGPETEDQFFKRWDKALRETFFLTYDFGRYCHEGFDLLDDTMVRLGEAIPDGDVLSEIEGLALGIVDELEAQYCSFCNDKGDE